MSDLPSNAPSPRLCHIAKWSDFDGYGFNLHADKSRPGQYIGKVDENSPADVAGLREGDRIIEVNGVNISNENHKQVVKRIKAVTNETKLLVIDSEGDRWYKDHNLVIRGDQSNIKVKTSSKQQQKEQSTDSPAGSQKSASLKNEKINSNSSSAHDEDNKSVASSSSLQSEQSTQQQQSESREEDNVVESCNEPMNNMNIDDGESDLLPPPPPPVEDKNGPEETLDPDLSTEYDNVRFEQEKNENGDGTKDHLEDNHSLSSHASHASSRSCEETTAKADNDGTTGSVHDADDLERKSPMSTTPSPPPSLNPEGGSTGGKESPSLNNTGGLNLNMTAAEMRAHLASKKKFDPRKDSIDLKKKYEIIQNM